MHPAAHLQAVDHQEVPGLHEAHRRRMVRGVQQPGQHLGRHGVRQELGAHVPSLVNRAVEAIPLWRGKA